MKRRRPISKREFQPITEAEILKAQHLWAKYVTQQNVEKLLDLYDFGNLEQPLLFKPTLANVIRTDRTAARSYFVGGNPLFPNDKGFLKHEWKLVNFSSAAGPIANPGGLGYRDMGHYAFVNTDGNTTSADYTFIYHKLENRVLISLHHSSLTWNPPEPMTE